MGGSIVIDVISLTNLANISSNTIVENEL